MEFKLINSNEILNKLIEMVVLYGPRLLGAMVVFLIGIRAIKLINKTSTNVLDKQNLDKSLKPFLHGIVSIVLKAVLAISVLSMLGIEMTSFIAILGSAGLAIGMALSGTLQNFAGGVVILVLKPYKVGDFIEAQGFSGTVHEIQIFNTMLKTPDNKTIIIPNGGLSTGSLINYTTESIRRVDWTVSISYGDSTENARKVLKELCDSNSSILDSPEVLIAVSNLNNSSVDFTVRAWVKTEDYFDVFFWMNEQVYNTFGKSGLNIPFPQLDVHLKQKIAN